MRIETLRAPTPLEIDLRSRKRREDYIETPWQKWPTLEKYPLPSHRDLTKFAKQDFFPTQKQQQRKQQDEDPKPRNISCGSEPGLSSDLLSAIRDFRTLPVS